MKTILDGMEVGFAEMKADIAEVKTDIAEMKADIGEMKTDIREMKTDIGVIKTNIAEMKTGFIKLHTKLDRIDNRTEFLVDHNEQHFVEDRHSHQGALSIDICTLDVIVASLLFRKTSNCSVPSKIECDRTLM